MTSKIKPTLEAEIAGFGKIYRVDTPFNQDLELLSETGAKIISLRDLAYARIKEGIKHSLSKSGSYVIQAGIWIPKENPLFIAESPIITLATEKTSSFSKGRGFCLDEEEGFLEFEEDPKNPYLLRKKFNEFYLESVNSYLDQAKFDKKKSPEERNILALGQRGRDVYFIPTNRFGEDEITLWAFKDQAKTYGDFLREAGIKKTPILPVSPHFVNAQDKPFATQLCLFGIGRMGCSDIYGGRSCDKFNPEEQTIRGLLVEG